MRRPGTRGFTFIEVIMALSILVVGAVSVLGLFSLGVRAQMQRRINAREIQVRPEIQEILQTAVDAVAPGEVPKPNPSRHDLSLPDYGVEVEWRRDPFGGSTQLAVAYLTFRGHRVKTIGPQPVPRSTMNPATLDAKAGAGNGN